MDKETGWGGSRPRAGRKPLKDPKKPRSIKFSDAEWEVVKKMAAMVGVSTSEFIRMKALDTKRPPSPKQEST